MKIYFDYDRMGFKPLEEKMAEFFMEMKNEINTRLRHLNKETELGL
jgi:hypothetical protein